MASLPSSSTQYSGTSNRGRGNRGRGGRQRGGRGASTRGGRGEGGGQGEGGRNEDGGQGRGGRGERGGPGQGGRGGGMGGGGGEGHEKHKPSPLHFGKLRRMTTIDPTDAVLDLVKHKEQLQNLLEDAQLKDDYLQLLLEILANVYDTHMKENLIKILALFPNTPFLQRCLPRYIMQLPMKGRGAKPEKHIINIITLFDQLLRKFPDLYTEIPLDSLIVATMSMQSTMKSEIAGKVQELLAVRESIIDRQTRKESQKNAKKTEEREEKPPDDFRTISVYPTTEDFDSDNNVFLRKNIVKGKYRDVDHYLDVQFRLLREDFIGPLREGVDELSQGMGRNERNQNLRIYREVVIVDTVCTHSGIVYRIRFDTRRLQRVKWESSKRLIFGAFLCLSKDNFQTLVFATITDRKADEIKDGYLQVRFLGNIPDLQSGDRFQMVESPGYYESYCHNLQGLQELDNDKMPFTRYLVDCETQVNVPNYLANEADNNYRQVEDDPLQQHQPQQQQQPTYDLRETLKAKHGANLKAVEILDPTSWPNHHEVQPNHSQLEAIKAALTKEFVVIQGPPGTGKTYVGLRIVQALISNQIFWRHRVPIEVNRFHREIDPSQSYSGTMLVVCYTNHALDQFLEGILEFCPTGVVRVGGRSSSEQLTQHNLSHKARRTAAWYETSNQLTAMANKIEITKKALALSYSEYSEIEQLSLVMDRNVVGQFQAYIPVAHYLGTTVLGAWLNMQPLPWYAPPSVQADPNLWSGGENMMGDEEEENDNEDDEDDTAEEDDEENGDEMANNDDKAEDETVDVEEDAERLRAERELGDDFAPINRPDDVTKVDMMQNYINMVNRAARDQDNQHQSPAATILQYGQSVWSLKYNDRKALYDDWVRQYREIHAQELGELTREYDVISRQMQEIKHGQEEDALRQAVVVGMTTTGAAKYRNVLQKIQPKLVVVEEAAEVLEAHIITALSKGAEHLILIGDHKQLKPNPSVYTLAKEYNLEVSLFERMVTNGMECHTLSTQHRMRPEIAQLMKHIYDDLHNHGSVENFPDIEGISKNMFFIDHQHPEKTDDELRSHANEHEANYIIALCQYLLNQGYERSRITVLTAYTGQLLALKKLMPKQKFEGVRICSIDNFQGEENDIILLSLVRSNEERKIGFLGTSNRVCVALSRARMGFYCIGNISLLAERSELWAKIKADLEKQGAIGTALSIYCRNHKGTKVEVSTARDFRKAPAGGCSLPCDFRLDCGHKCEMVCHPLDREHVEYTCGKKCDKEVCSLGHRCKRQCHHGSSCGKCESRVPKSLPQCGHQQLMPCHKDATTFECKLPCEKTLSCGHRCQSTCGKTCDSRNCQEKIQKTLPCGHTHNIECSTPADMVKCDVKCTTILECDHPCSGNCHDCIQGRVHRPCSQPCERNLICSHPCKEPCTRYCPPCSRDCENACLHSKCSKKCGELCAPCQEPCQWACEHKKCKKKCSEICDRKPCNVQCKKKLQCGGKGKRKKHACVGLCGEKCPRLCRTCNKDELTEIFFGTEDKPRARFIELLDCKHVFEVDSLDQWMASVDDDVTEIQLKQCPKCKTPIRKSLRYGNMIKKTLMDIEMVKKKVLDENKDSLTTTEKLLKQAEVKLARKYPLSLKSCQEVYSQKLDNKQRMMVSSQSNVHTSGSQSAFLNLANRIISSESKNLASIENVLQLLVCIYEIKTKFAKAMGDNNSDETKKLRAAVNGLEKILIDSKMTVQVMDELKNEIARVGLKCRLYMIQESQSTARLYLSPGTQSQLSHMSDALSSARRIDEDERRKFEDSLNEISRQLGIGEITAQERAEIVKAIGLTQGHWFKCRNGHAYAIGECGGAMEKAVCPECQDVIGGEHHRLVEGNQVASEMDGARFAAWSDQANLENYDLDDLQDL